MMKIREKIDIYQMQLRNLLNTVTISTRWLNFSYCSLKLFWHLTLQLQKYYYVFTLSSGYYALPCKLFKII